jgi:hypothetical protein
MSGQIDTPIEDLLIEIEWESMAERDRERDATRSTS